MFGKQKGGGDSGRRQTRSRKVSQRIAVVDESARRQAVQARLDALEADNADAPDPLGLAGDDDDEFVLDSEGEEEVDLGGKRKRRGAGGPKRKTRAMLADTKIPRTFARLLEDSGIENAREGVPTYLTAAVGPSTEFAARKFCSVCGFESPYTCARCGSRFCTKRCYVVHTETRCLKFIS